MVMCVFVNVHWKTSAMVQMAMLVLMTVFLSTATASPIPAHRGRLRVGRPCSGRHAESVDLPSPNNTDEGSVTHHQLRRAVRSVTMLIAHLYDDVDQFKKDYATKRDVPLDLGMRVVGMPRPDEIGLRFATSHSESVDFAATVADITPKLSQVAVFVSLLRLEERHETRPFNNELDRIEDHSEHGLYGILCRLHVVHQLASALNGTTSNDVDDLAASIDVALAGVQLKDAPHPVYRYIRAVSIISDFAQLLQRLIFVLDFAVHLPPSVISTSGD